MELKWYEELKDLVVAPFSRGIDQVIEGGTIHKGFMSNLWICFIGIVLIAIVTAILTESVGAAFGNLFAGLLQVGVQLLFTFIGVMVHASIFTWIANKLGGKAMKEDVVKVDWYLQAYNTISIVVFYAIALVILATSTGAASVFGESDILSIISFWAPLLLLYLAYFVWMTYFSLVFVGRQVSLNKTNTFVAEFLTIVVIVGFFVAVFGLFALLLSVAR